MKKALLAIIVIGLTSCAKKEVRKLKGEYIVQDSYTWDPDNGGGLEFFNETYEIKISKHAKHKVEIQGIKYFEAPVYAHVQDNDIQILDQDVDDFVSISGSGSRIKNTLYIQYIITNPDGVSYGEMTAKKLE
ncbi:MAG: hypothetical protein MRY83_00725 [Flavobacteriales bacterium]|nr:hypothetical protein [Flavobacteriales bacterium]